MNKIYLLLVLSCLIGRAGAQTTTFSFVSPGNLQTYTVPAGVTQLSIDAWGGAGGNPYYVCGNTVTHSNGGRVQCTLAVTGGEVLYIYVGSKGGDDGCGSAGFTTVTGGFNGGRNSTFYGGASGGATDIRLTPGTISSSAPYTVTPYTATNRIIVAGGGGGGADYYGTGGGGGGLVGGTGLVGTLGGTPGSGGTQTGPGPSGATLGTLGVGGAASSYGPGGGGYWGGNGGSGTSGGGGGGSSYTDPVLCTSVVHTQGYSGATGDGQVIITVLCTATGTITGTKTVCTGATTTLSNTTAGGTGTWYSSNTSIATVDPSTGVVTAVSAGTVIITDSVNNPCGGASATAVVTVNTTPAAISGTASSCPSGTSVLSSSPSGGTWSSSNLTIASVGSTGLVTAGSGSGTATISYSLGNGCAAATKVFTVNPNPASITGAGTICGGTVPTTITLGDATTGGTWSSSNVGLATVGSSTGVVSGVSSGTPTITYTLPTTCFATTPVTVNAVAAISGLPSICLGSSVIYSDATAGGTWGSSVPSVATINSSGVANALSVGSTIISYTVGSIGCAAVMTVNVTPSTLTVFSVTGGGSYCAGSGGVHIGLSNSSSGVTYTLFNGGTVAGTAVGTGSTLDFGLFTATGTYTVIGNYGSSCATNMSGSATVSINPLPSSYSVSTGGSYCSGGAGVHVTLNSSTIGVNYQLMQGSTSVGAPLAGTGSTLDFGAQTTAGTYTVIATNTTTGCTLTMSGTATITINSLPTTFSVTGGGGYCTGSTGVHVGLSSSSSGTSYQLLLGGSPVGSALSGTGSALDFGIMTTAGTYTVLATNTATGCTNTMSGTAVVTINPLPSVFTVTGGGSYCSGGTGVAIGLAGSATGVNYQLFNGTSSTGSPVAGTGVALNFGLQTAAGSYTVVATNATTGCINNMTGSASVAINSLPTSFSVTGGGSYCAGGAGLLVGISGSVSGTTYSLYNGTTLVGAASGTGSPLDFGLQLTPGVYTVNAMNTSTGCSGNMSGSVTISINPLPGAFTLTGGGSYCAGGSGVTVGLTGSASGVSYQLYNGSTITGSPVSGTGSAISFGSQTAAGSYTVVANNTSTGCTSNMLGSSLVTINPAPTVYAVTGGGGFCAGGTGVHVGITSSNTGITYQLTSGGSPVGSAIAGTGAAIDFGIFTTAGTYNVTATNPSNGCSSNMSGSAAVAVNPLPTAFSVVNGGAYCAGGSGVHVGLANSTAGVNYQLFNGSAAVGGSVAGTGSPLDFGLETATGSYTAIAVNATTGCTNNMLGSTAVSTNPLPAVFALTGGGSYCAGGSGVHVGLSGSVTGVNYQLMNGVASVSTTAGSGSAIDFGSLPAGSYTVVATNSSTGCSSNMAGTSAVVANPLPAAHNITGGGAYCTGGAGLHVGLDASNSGINYQLYSGLTPVGVPVAGTGAALDFGVLTAGNYIVTATNAVTGCSSPMTGSAAITVNPLPSLHSVAGGGTFCAGGSGVTVSLDGSNTGTSYQLFNGAVSVGAAVPGTTGVPVSFGSQTAPGNYTVVATNTSTGCSTIMTGSATVAVNPLPITYNVTGGGSFCSGGAGVHIGLNSSATGIMYQLWNGTAMVGFATPGTGAAIDFGLQTSAGTYTITARNPATACGSNMTGSANVVVNPLPAAHTVTGGGSYCSGGSGVHVGLNGSDLGTSYQLLNGGIPVGSAVAGTGAPIDFGAETSAGNYTVQATNPATGCNTGMTANATVNVAPLPGAYPVVGGGSYCSGGSGVNVALNNSDPGVIYQLYAGTTPAGASITGTGAAINFGLQTAAGTYSVVASDPSTSCSANMSNTVSVSLTPLPSAYLVTGGGNYCTGGSGVHIRLNGSSTGVTYQLWYGSTPVGVAQPGTGSSLDFGLQTATGGYTVVATSGSTTCTNVMTGSATVGTNPLPAPFTLSSVGSSFCAGGAGIDITLAGSVPGVTYQLYNGGTAIGSPVTGTGSAIDFGHQTAGGSYVAIATNGTGCTNNMTGTVNITVNPLPNAYLVTGGGSYCAGAAGVHVGLSGSDIGVTYSLYQGFTLVATATGTSGPIDFGVQTGAGGYSVIATSTVAACSNNMTGTASIVVNPVPNTYSVSGGGAYCAGGTGVHIGLSGSSAGVRYQLFRGTLPVGSAATGSGIALDLGAQTAAGTYTVVATDIANGCTSNMGGSASITINAAPVVYAVSGGGSFCNGGTGVHVGLSSSASGVTYQLYNGLALSGSSAAGTGTSIDFGVQATPGTYTVIATNTTTGCTSNMAGSANVVVNPLPAAYAVMGGGSYCAGGSGVHIGLAGSASGVTYSLMNGSSTVATISGVSGPLDFGFQTVAGTYTVHAVNATTGCAANMTGSTTVSITPITVPSVSISTGVSDTLCDGSFVTFTANAVNGGSAPVYQWRINSVVAGTGSSYGYIPANGDVVHVTVTSSATCASPASVDASKTMTVQPNQSPAVSVAANPGSIVCQGTSVTYTASPSYGGNTPAYVWYKNGGIVPGATSDTYIYVPANGDVVYSTMTSNYMCRTANSASSTHISMEVDVPATPAVTVTSDQGLNVAPGQTVTFTAAITNTIPSPTYQWMKNSGDIPGATSSAYTTNSLFDGDVVACKVTSGGGCAGSVGSGSVTIHVRGDGVAQITTAGSDIKLLPNPNKGSFVVKGSLGTQADEEVAVEITDMLGKVIYTSKIVARNGEINEKIELGGSVANGMYIMSLHSGAGSQVFHLVVEQ